MKKIKIFNFILIASLAITPLLGCNEEETEEPIIMVDKSESETVYSMLEISKGDVCLTTKLSCEYVQTQDQNVSFTAGGKVVDKVYVKVGDHVEPGDLLLTMDCGNILDEIASLEYQIERNTVLMGYLDKDEERALQNEEYTYIYEYYSPQTEEEINKHNHKLYLIQEDYAYKRQDYQDNIDFDKKKLAKLKKEYDENHVYATMSGKVSNIKTDLEGSVAKKDDCIMSIVDNDSGLFEINDKELAKYFDESTSVPMSIIYGSGKGEYELIPHNYSEWQDMSALQFEILSKPASATLEVGASGTIIATVDKKENVVRIPIRALYEADGKYYTYVLNSNNMREAQFIEVGLVGDDFAEVIKGIDVGMKVVSR